MKAPLPAAIAHAFVEDALAYLDEPDPIKRNANPSAAAARSQGTPGVAGRNSPVRSFATSADRNGSSPSQ
jgi:hypothetical protein